jgi:dipeptide/tripeptide permease
LRLCDISGLEACASVDEKIFSNQFGGGGMVFGGSFFRLVAVELALSGTSPLRIALPAMAGVHALIGIGEALITAVVLSVVLASRPDLVGAWKSAAVDSCTSEG